jgi:hypothetical protein
MRQAHVKQKRATVGFGQKIKNSPSQPRTIRADLDADEVQKLRQKRRRQVDADDEINRRMIDRAPREKNNKPRRANASASGLGAASRSLGK